MKMQKIQKVRGISMNEEKLISNEELSEENITEVSKKK